MYTGNGLLGGSPDKRGKTDEFPLQKGHIVRRSIKPHIPLRPVNTDVVETEANALVIDTEIEDKKKKILGDNKKRRRNVFFGVKEAEPLRQFKADIEKLQGNDHPNFHGSGFK
jgi:hypothetical protein